MSQQNVLLPLTFQLSGENVQITYVTSGPDGKPHLTYQEGAQRYDGEELRLQQTDLGSEVTIYLEFVPNSYAVTATLIVPNISRLQGPSDPVEALVVKHLNWMVMPPPQPTGTAQVYRAILLKGTVQRSPSQ